MKFPIYGKIKVMFQTTNQVQVLGQVATSFDVKIPQWPKMPKVLCTKKCWHSRFLLLKNDWTEQERFNQTKQSYKSKRTCHTMNGLKDPVLPAWLRVAKTMSKQTVVNPRYSPHQTYLIAVWMFVYPWVLLRKHPNLGRLTLVHIHTFYRSIWSFVSCWATFFVGCIMLYPIIPIYWPHPKLYLFNSHVCLVNPVGQAHPLWNYGQGIIRARKPRSHVHTEAPFQPYDHLRTQLIITCTHQRAHDHMYTQILCNSDHMCTPLLLDLI